MLINNKYNEKNKIIMKKIGFLKRYLFQNHTSMTIKLKIKISRGEVNFSESFFPFP